MVRRSKQLPDDWETKRLGELCDLQNGYAFKSKSYIEDSNTLNIRMSNIRPHGEFDPEHNIKYLPDSFADDYRQFLLEEGDLIVAMTDMATLRTVLKTEPETLDFTLELKRRNPHSAVQNLKVSGLLIWQTTPKFWDCLLWLKI